MLLAALLAGCRTSGDVEALKRENFELSEQVTALEVHINQCCRELRTTQELLAAKDETTDSSGSRRTPAGDDGSPSDLPKPPKVDLGAPGGKEPTPAPRFEKAPKYEPGSKASFEGPDAGVGPELGPLHSVSASRGHQEVAAITVDRRQTSGFDADESQPGDEGIVVVVEPRNAHGQVVRVAGEVSIAAYDASLWRQYGSQPTKRQLAHVGTWLFNPTDAATWFEEEQPRMRFELPWPAAGAPKNKDLQLVVKYQAAGGRVLEAQSLVSVQLTGRRPKAPGVPSSPVASSSSAPQIAAPPGEVSALRKPPVSTEAGRPPASLPRREGLVPRPEVSDARPNTEVPSRQRPVWTPYR
jgi:hypothetical protein